MPFLQFDRARAALLRGETSCEALVSFFLSRIADVNPRLNAFVHVDADRSIERARGLDAAGGFEALPLAGMVMAVKDVICVRGSRVTCGSRMLADFVSQIDATAVTRLQAAGAIIVGKTNCDEFAMGSSNENSFFGPVRNPVDLTRVPGGSSGGSAAAVAAGLCHVALGTDTGGSIRQPAAFCGVVGLKPTYGRVSRYGLVAYASSFDSIGPLARTVADASAVLAVMAGADPNDATCAEVAVPPAIVDPADLQGVRIGIPAEYFEEGLDPAVAERTRAAIERLQTAGAEIKHISLPHTRYGIATYYLLTTAEASSNLARYDGVRYGFRAASTADDDQSALDAMYTATRTQGFGDEVKRRIMLGTYALSAGYYDAYYGKAQRVRTLIRQDFERAFERVDVIATPATPTPAFELGSKTSDPLDMYLSDVYTVTANLAGIPGLVIPAGSVDGLPVGLQLLGPHFSEERLLCAGRVLEAC